MALELVRNHHQTCSFPLSNEQYVVLSGYFTQFEKDGDLELSPSELKSLVKDVAHIEDEKKLAETTNLLMQKLDKSKSNSLNFSEFMSGYAHLISKEDDPNKQDVLRILKIEAENAVNSNGSSLPSSKIEPETDNLRRKLKTAEERLSKAEIDGQKRVKELEEELNRLSDEAKNALDGQTEKSSSMDAQLKDLNDKWKTEEKKWKDSEAKLKAEEEKTKSLLNDQNAELEKKSKEEARKDKEHKDLVDTINRLQEEATKGMSDSEQIRALEDQLKAEEKRLKDSEERLRAEEEKTRNLINDRDAELEKKSKEETRKDKEHKDLVDAMNKLQEEATKSKSDLERFKSSEDNLKVLDDKWKAEEKKWRDNEGILKAEEEKTKRLLADLDAQLEKKSNEEATKDKEYKDLVDSMNKLQEESKKEKGDLERFKASEEKLKTSNVELVDKIRNLETTEAGRSKTEKDNSELFSKTKSDLETKNKELEKKVKEYEDSSAKKQGEEKKKEIEEISQLNQSKKTLEDELKKNELEKKDLEEKNKKYQSDLESLRNTLKQLESQRDNLSSEGESSRKEAAQLNQALKACEESKIKLEEDLKQSVGELERFALNQLSDGVIILLDKEVSFISDGFYSLLDTIEDDPDASENPDMTPRTLRDKKPTLSSQKGPDLEWTLHSMKRLIADENDLMEFTDLLKGGYRNLPLNVAKVLSYKGTNGKKINFQLTQKDGDKLCCVVDEEEDELVEEEPEEIEEEQVEEAPIANEAPKPPTPKKPKFIPVVGDKLDLLVQQYLEKSGVLLPKSIKRVGPGQYLINGQKVSIKMVNGHLVVRVGGGWATLEDYLKDHSIGNASTNVAEGSFKTFTTKGKVVGVRSTGASSPAPGTRSPAPGARPKKVPVQEVAEGDHCHDDHHK